MKSEKWIREEIYTPNWNKRISQVRSFPPSSVNVTNVWSYTSTLPIRFNGMVLN
jgi:hypothetical protein